MINKEEKKKNEVEWFNNDVSYACIDDIGKNLMGGEDIVTLQYRVNKSGINKTNESVMREKIKNRVNRKQKKKDVVGKILNECGLMRTRPMESIDSRSDNINLMRNQEDNMSVMLHDIPNGESEQSSEKPKCESNYFNAKYLKTKYFDGSKKRLLGLLAGIVLAIIIGIILWGLTKKVPRHQVVVDGEGMVLQPMRVEGEMNEKEVITLSSTIVKELKE